VFYDLNVFSFVGVEFNVFFCCCAVGVTVTPVISAV